ncbi:monovalent cation/H+ antiporter complex subunit F [Corynebacterium hansenii]|uniref:Monovalent cation/H+ antiporter complex subunit F n=1 Tax=Corynebacterium hansenii TaxID=394964 RepID=A0ABV7ZPE8_9CORY|nr:monovalent cation/H+ antiporter complex subunit F [Corynebacterium hansenii]WJY98837.1 putative monovalent cation/H+ antiporter subunit F [Corynebacterium hansenii]
MSETLVHAVGGIGVALCSVAFLITVILVFRVKGNVSRAVMSDVAFFSMVGVFLTTALFRETAITFDIAMLAGLLGILSTVGLSRVISRGRR